MRTRLAFLVVLLLGLTAQVEAVSRPAQAAAVGVVADDAPASTAVPTRKALRQARRAERQQSRLARAISRLIDRPADFDPDRPRPPRNRGQGMAIASLPLGIVGLLTFPFVVAPLLALIFGAIGLNRYREGYHDRRGLAIAGLVLGVVGLLLGLWFWGTVVVSGV